MYKTVQVILLCVIIIDLPIGFPINNIISLVCDKITCSAASQLASMQLQCLARLLAPLAHAPRWLIPTNLPRHNAPELLAVLLWQVQFDENESCVF